MKDEDLYPDDLIEIVDLDKKVYADEKREDKITVREIIEKYWNGEPFIALSTEY